MGKRKLVILAFFPILISYLLHLFNYKRINGSIGRGVDFVSARIKIPNNSFMVMPFT